MLSDGGAVVNAASTTGLESHPKNSANSATKHAVNGLSKSAAGGMGGRGSRSIMLRRKSTLFHMVVNAWNGTLRSSHGLTEGHCFTC